MSIQFEKLSEIPWCQNAEKQKYSGLGNMRTQLFLFLKDKNLGLQVAPQKSFKARTVKFIYVMQDIWAHNRTDVEFKKCYFLGAFSTFFVLRENWTMKIGLFAITGGHQPKEQLLAFSAKWLKWKKSYLKKTF